MNIFFMSYKESNAEDNWIRVKFLHKDAIRLHGITGIDSVHMLCNQLSKTDYFWTVDGDNWLLTALDYNYNSINTDLVIFKAVDPLQKKLTGLGGVKLWRKDHFVNKDMSKGDFTLNATKDKIILDKAFSETRYNSSPFDAWKTAFRHCVKCMTVIFRSRPLAKNLDTYIAQWRNCQYINELNANYAYLGYLDAVDYSKKFDNNIVELSKINDYNWLENYFNAKYV